MFWCRPFEFISVRALWASWICMSSSFSRFGKFINHYFFKEDFCHLSFSSHSETSIKRTLVCLVFSYWFLKLSSFFFIFLSFCFSDWMSFSAIYLRLLIFSLLHLGCCWMPLSKYFSFQLLYSPVLWLLVSTDLFFYIFTEVFTVFIHSSPKVGENI